MLSHFPTKKSKTVAGAGYLEQVRKKTLFPAILLGVVYPISLVDGGGKGEAGLNESSRGSGLIVVMQRARRAEKGV